MLTIVTTVEVNQQGATIHQLHRKRNYKIGNRASLRVRIVSQDSARCVVENNGVDISVKTCGAGHC